MTGDSSEKKNDPEKPLEKELSFFLLCYILLVLHIIGFIKFYSDWIWNKPFFCTVNIHILVRMKLRVRVKWRKMIMKIRVKRKM